ncbi:MAG TPA: DUF1385 domain-containing protein [Bacteroidota bacterium]|nr:DUF1385 domain-containing protein [Bacteroidota bacterium]
MENVKTKKYQYDAANPMQVGGQAVIEGVMMRAPGMIATALRRADGTILLRKDPFKPLSERSRFFALPVLRGAAGLFEMLVMGLRMLNYSAEVALRDIQGTSEKDDRYGSNGDKRGAPEAVRFALVLALALASGTAIFFVVPLVATTALFRVEQEPAAFNAIAGLLRLMILLAYLLAISTMKDVRRLFQYHGAEHKAVFAFELGQGIDVRSVASQKRFHPRCGTSFLLVVMLVAIVLFSLLDTLLIAILGPLTLTIRLATHLPLLPLLAGVSYECIRFSARRSETFLGRLFVAPGLWLQKITTKEPDEKQIEVAIEALRSALDVEHSAPLVQERVLG